eukprot:gene20761-31986_t
MDEIIKKKAGEYSRRERRYEKLTRASVCAGVPAYRLLADLAGSREVQDGLRVWWVSASEEGACQNDPRTPQVPLNPPTERPFRQAKRGGGRKPSDGRGSAADDEADEIWSAPAALSRIVDRETYFWAYERLLVTLGNVVEDRLQEVVLHDFLLDAAGGPAVERAPFCAGLLHVVVMVHGARLTRSREPLPPQVTRHLKEFHQTVFDQGYPCDEPQAAGTKVLLRIEALRKSATVAIVRNSPAFDPCEADGLPAHAWFVAPLLAAAFKYMPQAYRAPASADDDVVSEKVAVLNQFVAGGGLRAQREEEAHGAVLCDASALSACSGWSDASDAPKYGTFDLLMAQCCLLQDGEDPAQLATALARWYAL